MLPLARGSVIVVLPVFSHVKFRLCSPYAVVL